MSESKSKNIESLDCEPVAKKQNVGTVSEFDKIEQLIKNRGYSEHIESNFMFDINNHKIYVTKFSIMYGLSNYASKNTTLLHTLINECAEKIIICDLPSIKNVNVALFLDYLDILIHKNVKIVSTGFKTMIDLSHIFETDIIDHLIVEAICCEKYFTYENIMYFAHNEEIFKKLVHKKIEEIKTQKAKTYTYGPISIPSINDFALGSSIEAKNKAYFINELFKILVKA
jgi:hypothetical protein